VQSMVCLSTSPSIIGCISPKSTPREGAARQAPDCQLGCDAQAARDQPVLEHFLLEHRGDSGLSEAATECGGRTTASGPEQPTTPASEHSGDLGLSEAATDAVSSHCLTNADRTASECELTRWRRTVAVFVMTVLSVGLQFSFASLLVAFKEAFPSVSVRSLAAVGSVSMGAVDLLSAVSGLVIIRYGERVACICGGAVAGVGLFLASFASDVWGLTATYGGALQRERVLFIEPR
jgi:hypothetical protein